jgi:hypothetical protein
MTEHANDLPATIAAHTAAAILDEARRQIAALPSVDDASSPRRRLQVKSEKLRTLIETHAKTRASSRRPRIVRRVSVVRNATRVEVDGAGVPATGELVEFSSTETIVTTNGIDVSAEVALVHFPSVKR